MTLRIEIMPNANLPPALQTDLDQRGYEIFRSAGANLTDIDWSGGDWRLIVWEGERWVSSMELLERQIMVGDEALRVGGVSGVMTPPEYRGRGYASAAVARASRWILEERRLPFGLLVTGAHLIRFYSAVGWQQVVAPLAYHQGGERRFFQDDTVIMVLAAPGRRWPPGTIDLQGLPW